MTKEANQLTAEKAREIVAQGMPEPRQVFAYSEWLQATQYLGFLERSAEVKALAAALQRARGALQTIENKFIAAGRGGFTTMIPIFAQIDSALAALPPGTI